MTPPARSEQTTESRNDNASARTAAPAVIEFPTPGRAPKPQWRKELSERVREIQQRKAQEAAREADAIAPPVPAPDPTSQPTTDAEAQTPPLGLVPPQPTPALNPLVANALKRIERARQQPVSQRAGRRGHGAAAAARVVREEYEVAPPAPRDLAPAVEHTPPPAPHAQQQHNAAPAQTTTANAPQPTAATVVAETQTAGSPSAESTTVAPHAQAEPLPDAPRPVNLVVVPPPAQTDAHAQTDTQAHAPAAEQRPKARRHIPIVLDEAYLARREAETVAAAATPVPGADDRAPLPNRVVGGIIDLLVVAFAATPFAAIIELTNGNWADVRVAGSMGGIVVVVLFLYVMASTALAGRTWGLALTGLRTADAATGGAPSTGQCARRAIGFMLALATGGLGLVYALFDGERRALHDHLSGTIVVRE